MGTAEAAKIFEHACAGRRRCHTSSVAGASVDALGGCLSAVAVGQRVCGRSCADGNDHRGGDGGRVRNALGNHDAILRKSFNMIPYFEFKYKDKIYLCQHYGFDEKPVLLIDHKADYLVHRTHTL